MERFITFLSENSQFRPLPHAFVMFYLSSLFNTRKWDGHIEHIRQGTPRATLLMGLAVLSAAPFALLWTAALLLLLRQRVYRSWLLGGALVGSLFPMAVFGALGGDVREVEVSLMNDSAHIGLVIGAGICSLSCVKGRRSAQANVGEEHEAVTSTEPSEEQEVGISTKPSVDEISPSKTPGPTRTATPITAETANYRLSLIITIILTWLAESECEKLADDRFRDLSMQFKDRGDKLLFGNLVFGHLCGLFLYSLAAWWYMRTSSNLAWEAFCGLLGGISGLATLRLSTSDLSPQSWIIDGALAFLAANVSLGVGVLTRNRLMARSFSTHA